MQHWENTMNGWHVTSPKRPRSNHNRLTPHLEVSTVTNYRFPPVNGEMDTTHFHPAKTNFISLLKLFMPCVLLNHSKATENCKRLEAKSEQKSTTAENQHRPRRFCRALGNRIDCDPIYGNCCFLWEPWQLLGSPQEKGSFVPFS